MSIFPISKARRVGRKLAVSLITAHQNLLLQAKLTSYSFGREVGVTQTRSEAAGPRDTVPEGVESVRV